MKFLQLQLQLQSQSQSHLHLYPLTYLYPNFDLFHKVAKCACSCGEWLKVGRYSTCGRTRYIKNHNQRMRGGSKSNLWKGGISYHEDGYMLVRSHGHPFSDKRGYVKRSRLTLEKYVGRYLTKDELVHHKNGDKTDDRIENLALTDRKEHPVVHSMLGPRPICPRCHTKER